MDYKPHYNSSFALVVGIDKYKNMTSLGSAVRGAKEVANYLREGLKFDVTEIYNKQATRQKVLHWFEGLDTGPDDRVIFYFAGHGMTQKLQSRSKGYLALSDSDSFATSLAIDNLLDQIEILSAKHILYLLDACFSGLALGGREVDFDHTRRVDRMLTRPAHFAITAGGAEVVDDDGGGEYSLFTHWLLEAFKDRSLQADGILSAKEIGEYVSRNVSEHRRSRALPNYGRLQGSSDGDFILQWDTGIRLPYDLELGLSSNLLDIRRGAVSGLFRLTKGDDTQLVEVAKKRLISISEEDFDEELRSLALQYLVSDVEELGTEDHNREVKVAPINLLLTGIAVASLVILFVMSYFLMKADTPDAVTAEPIVSSSPETEEIVPIITKVLFEDNFEGGLSDGWYYMSSLTNMGLDGGSWGRTTTEDGGVLQGRLLTGDWMGIYGGELYWKDYAFEVKVRIISSDSWFDQGGVDLYFRLDDDRGTRTGCLRNYSLQLRAQDMRIVKVGNDCWESLRASTKGIPLDEWVTVRVEVRGDQITVFLDDEFVTEVIDIEDYLQSGSIGLSVQSDTTATVLFDDVRVTELVPLD